MIKYFNLKSIAFLAFSLLFSCNGKQLDHHVKLQEKNVVRYNGVGIGPIADGDSFLVQRDGTSTDSLFSIGSELYTTKCITCHALNEDRKIGPGLKGVTQRRRPEWILNQMLNPLEMTQKDSMASVLLKTYLAQMVDMNLTQSDARALLAFLKKNDRE